MRSATKLLCLGVAMLGLLAGASQARAGLLGDSVDTQYIYPTAGTFYQDLGTLAVNPSATFNSFGQTDYTVTDSNITITDVNGTPVNFTPAAFNGVTFTDVTRNPGITGVTIDSSTNLAGFNSSLISFTGDEVSVNLQSLTMLPTSVVSLDLQFSSVPEPATHIGAGTAALVGLAYAWRRRRRAGA